MGFSFKVKFSLGADNVTKRHRRLGSACTIPSLLKGQYCNITSTLSKLYLQTELVSVALHSDSHATILTVGRIGSVNRQNVCKNVVQGSEHIVPEMKLPVADVNIFNYNCKITAPRHNKCNTTII